MLILLMTTLITVIIGKLNVLAGTRTFCPQTDDRLRDDMADFRSGRDKELCPAEQTTDCGTRWKIFVQDETRDKELSRAPQGL